MSQAPQVPLLKTFFITRPFQSSLVLVVYLLCKIDAHVQIQSSISFTLWIHNQSVGSGNSLFALNTNWFSNLTEVS